MTLKSSFWRGMSRLRALTTVSGPGRSPHSYERALVNRHPIPLAGAGDAEEKLLQRDASPPSAHYSQRTRPLPPFLRKRTCKQTSNNISWGGWRWRAASAMGCLTTKRSLRSADPAAPTRSYACAFVNSHLAEGGAEEQLLKRDVSLPRARYGQRTRLLPPVPTHAHSSTDIQYH